jgi:hypothetical protein
VLTAEDAASARAAFVAAYDALDPVAAEAAA